MWIRSDDKRDILPFEWEGRRFEVASDRGRIGIDNRPETEDFDQKRLADLLEESRAIQAESQRLATFLGKEGDGPLRGRNMFRPRVVLPPPATLEYSLHYWLIAVSAAVAPCWWGARFERRRLRVAMTKCPDCGYDVRATPGRCPECGNQIETQGRPT
jgi:hypothetical protein